MDVSSINERAGAVSVNRAQCHSPGCHSLSQRSSGNGLSELYCKRHIEFHRRHGSYWKRSIAAAELRPYSRAAREWMRGHRKDSFTQAVMLRLNGLIANSGAAVSAYDLRLMPATEKAAAVFAKLRTKAVPGARLMEIALAVATILDEIGFGEPEYRAVQISKAAFRAAGGTHYTSSGYRIRSKYPHSAGRVLRVFGSQVWDIAALVATPEAISEVSVLARPYVAASASKAKVRARAEERVACEIVRVRRAGMGPERLRQYRAQLRRQYGLPGPR
jgi:hypothetical protein